MKRPPGLWFLLSAGVLCMSIQLAYGVRATSLIFGKNKTTTTTTTEGSVGNSSASSLSSESVTEAGAETSNVTKPPLTGNPQLDYIWDPNLPKELNGFNLSDYPFYERVPEDVEIDFKCDGLHDGFYASVPHKCQVYHHCLFGTRYDFLCANFTAFDQKTFICHFASEVDCANSKKYWHRNDALYQAASTTTIKPNYDLYTKQPPQRAPSSSGSGGDDGGEQSANPKSSRRPPSGPGGGRRNPPARRPRPEYYDYEEDYDDDYYYEERPRKRWRNKRPRPRPRPRPIYEDDYEEDDEDDRFDRWKGRRDRDRRPAGDPPRRRMKDRRKYEDSEESIEEDKRPTERRNHSNKRRPVDDYVDDEEVDRRRSRPKNRRPAIEDDFDEEEEDNVKEKAEPVVDKPQSTGSIYDRTRTAPKVKPPVPKSEANKYAFKPTTAKSTLEDDEEYYDDYEEEPPKSSKSHRKPEGSESRHSVRRDEDRDTRKQLSSSASRLRPQRDEIEDDDEDTKRRSAVPKERPKFGGHRERTRPTASPKKTTTTTTEEYYEDYEEDRTKDRRMPSKFRPKLVSTTTSTTTTTPKPTTTTTRTTTSTRSTTTTTTTTTSKPSTTTSIKDLMREPLVRIVKRPFLPSRGGNPYSSRGLQPVGTKATEKPLEFKEDDYESTEIDDISEKPFKPSPVMIKVPVRQKFVGIGESDQDDQFKPVSNRPQTPITRPNSKPKDYIGPRTTQRPKVEEISDPLDIDEYDVTLNDALNPTLPNLPVRGYPAGFGADYTSYSTFQRPRYVVEPAVNPSNQEYTYQQQPPRQHYDTTVAKTYGNDGQEQFVNTDTKFTGQYSTISGQNYYRPRGSQTYYNQQN